MRFGRDSLAAATKTSDGKRSRKKSSLWLRILHINDVYKLDNFPHFKSLVDDKKKDGADKVLVVLAGDFLGPSLMSTLDKGHGMVDTMNACGVTHVCFGNHETDVPMDAIADRIQQSDFIWLNTNMRELDAVIGARTNPHDVVEVRHGIHSKKVGLMGLLLNDPSVYLPGAFGGATIEPIMETAKKYRKDGMPRNVDMIIPLTHQSIKDDREFAKKNGGKRFPVIIGGHDHEPYDEVHNGSRIIKTGSDVENTAVIDIRWDLSRDGKKIASKPRVDIELISTTNYAADPSVSRRIAKHQRIVTKLKSIRIFRIPDWLDTSTTPFSTKDNRLGQSSGSQVLASLMRIAMGSDVALINAGCIRRNEVYDKEQEWFTMGDLAEELPLPTELVVLPLPGRVLETMLRDSRMQSKSPTPTAFGGYIHHCDQIVYDDAVGRILSIGGKPFYRKRKYLTSLPTQFFVLDSHDSLVEWAKEEELEQISDGVPVKAAILNHGGHWC